MHLPLSIAFRYLLAKKSQNIINIISMISVIGIIIGTMALVVILSVFNGLHGLMGSLFTSFDPHLKIVSDSAKVFRCDSSTYERLQKLEGIKAISLVFEDNVLLKYGEKQVPATILGVDENFEQVTGIDSIIVEGKYKLYGEGVNRTVMGYILADQLGLRLNFVTPLMIYVPKRLGTINTARPDLSFNSTYVHPGGIFMVKQMDYDGKLFIVKLPVVREIFDYQDSEVTSIYIKTSGKANIPQLQKEIHTILGDNIKILNQEEQHATFYKMMKIEKFMAFLILAFILLIASFNLIGSLAMLIFEKKESINTLKNMGADKKFITRVFLLEGLLISISGALLGLILGVIIVLIQQWFGIITFSGDGNYIVNAYPIELQWMDVLQVFLTVSAIGFFASWYPVKTIVAKYYN